MAGGRPCIFDQAVFDAICDRLAEGSSLRAACREEGMPDERTVREWVADNKFGISPQYARAVEARAERLFEEIIEISDTSVVAEKVTTKANGDVETVVGDAVDRSRLRVDARKWALSKMLPKKYGDKVDVNVGGTGGGPIVSVSVDTKDPVEAARIYQNFMKGQE
jgi:hypothetical protein